MEFIEVLGSDRYFDVVGKFGFKQDELVESVFKKVVFQIFIYWLERFLILRED